MSARRQRPSPSNLDGSGFVISSPMELCFSQAFGSSPSLLASSARPSSEYQLRRQEWNNSEFTRLHNTEHSTSGLPPEPSSQQNPHLFQAPSEPAKEINLIATSALASWPSQPSLLLQSSSANASDSNALYCEWPSYETLSTNIEQDKDQQMPLQLSEKDFCEALDNDSFWERQREGQLATDLFNDFPCSSSDGIATSLSLLAAAHYANVTEETVGPMLPVSSEDSHLAQGAVYAPFSALQSPPSTPTPSKGFNFPSTFPQLGSSIGTPSVVTTAVRSPKRVLAACYFCKARKLRCDGHHPCGQCQKRSVECLYPLEGQAKRSKRSSDPSLVASMTSTISTSSEGERLSQRPLPQRRSWTRTAKLDVAAEQGTSKPYAEQLPASFLPQQWSSYGSTPLSDRSSITTYSAPNTTGNSTGAYSQGTSSNNASIKEGQSSKSSSSTVQRTCGSTMPAHNSRIFSNESGRKREFTTFNVPRGRTDRSNNERSAKSEVRYVCPYSGCSSHFSTSGHARRHSRVHAVLEPFMCPHKDCSKTFTLRDNCMQHQRARHKFQLVAYRGGKLPKQALAD